MTEEIIINHEAVELHANGIENEAGVFQPDSLPSAGGSTLSACKNSSQSYSEAQNLYASLGNSLSKDANMIREIGASFESVDHQIAGEMAV